MTIMGQVSAFETLESVFEASMGIYKGEEKRYIIKPGEEILSVTNRDSHKITGIHFGMLPFWQKGNKPIFEAPVHGKELPTGPAKLKHKIINEPAFRKPIRESRCLVPVDYFIMEENGKASLFFMEEHPFALAGIFDTWKQNIKDKELYTGCAILTVPAEGVVREAGFSVQPMVMDPKFHKKWLSDLHLSEVTGIMSQYVMEGMNGYEIDNRSLYSNNTGKEAIMPTSSFYRESTGKKGLIFRKKRHKKGETDDKATLEQRIWRA